MKFEELSQRVSANRDAKVPVMDMWCMVGRICSYAYSVPFLNSFHFALPLRGRNMFDVAEPPYPPRIIYEIRKKHVLDHVTDLEIY